MKNPASSVNPQESSNVLNDRHSNKNLFDFFDKKISPVETSSFYTINFAENPDAILFSTKLTACAVVIIKNKNPETSKYDNVVTMGHFYPTNAINDEQAAENISALMKGFQEKGGKINQDTSIILLGGAVLEGEDMQQTTPLGALFDFLNGNQRNLGYKFNHHNSSILTQLPTATKHESIFAFVNKDGTVILKAENLKIEAKNQMLTTFKSLTKSLSSMPVEMLSQIVNNSIERTYYPSHIKEFFERANKKIEEKMDAAGAEKPSIKMAEMESKIKMANVININTGRNSS